VLTGPSQCVDQAELEKFDGVSQGKYTIGLGQTKMSFCDDREGKIIATEARGFAV
jgi:3-hydroxy-3-methylglutaryl CoA synthase